MSPGKGQNVGFGDEVRRWGETGKLHRRVGRDEKFDAPAVAALPSQQPIAAPQIEGMGKFSIDVGQSIGEPLGTLGEEKLSAAGDRRPRAVLTDNPPVERRQRVFGGCGARHDGFYRTRLLPRHPPRMTIIPW